jgi:hypothetical protein
MADSLPGIALGLVATTRERRAESGVPTEERHDAVAHGQADDLHHVLEYGAEEFGAPAPD